MVGHHMENISFCNAGMQLVDHCDPTGEFVMATRFSWSQWPTFQLKVESKVLLSSLTFYRLFVLAIQLEYIHTCRNTH